MSSENQPNVKQYKSKSSSMSLRCLTEAAILVALSQVLSYIKLMELPNGGSLTPAMFPLILFAVRWGWKSGLLAGFAFGLLQLIFDVAYAWGWQSMLLDYLVAFTPPGLCRPLQGQKMGHLRGYRAGLRLPLSRPLYQRRDHLQDPCPHRAAGHDLHQPQLLLPGV